MNFGDGVARYDLRDDDHVHMHHHLICNVCGKLEEIKDDWLVELEARVAREYGFSVTDHRLDFKGTYNSCQKTAARVTRTAAPSHKHICNAQKAQG